MRIAITVTLNRPHAVEIARQTVAWLQAHGQEVLLAPATAEAVSCSVCRIPEEQLMAQADVVIAIGGDGTMLGAVRLAAPYQVPVLGVNAGALGFLTELAPEELPAYLPRLLARDYTLEARMMLEAHLYRGEQTLVTLHALNDIVVRQGAAGRLISLCVEVAGFQLGQMSADGLIVSTPTGSTAYGLAAGGPIVHPTATVMVLVPICPHSLAFRPVVVPAEDPVEIFCQGNFQQDEMMVSADGQAPVSVLAGDRIVVRPAPHTAQLIKFGRSSFYDRLREKLQWGGSNK